MKTHFNRRAYRLRGQVETVMSMLKRNLGPALRAKSRHGRRRDLRLRVLTHNIALALLEVFYRALPSLFFHHKSRRVNRRRGKTDGHALSKTSHVARPSRPC
jgi:hypothetical protein